MGFRAEMTLWLQAELPARLVSSMPLTVLLCLAVTLLFLLRYSETVARVYRYIRDPCDPAQPLSAKRYARAKEEASVFLRNRKQLGKVVLDQQANVSTICAATPRSGAAPATKTQRRLNLDACKGVISVDLDSGTVTAGGKTPFKALVEFLLPMGFAPKIVPELDTITVGGAISGVAIESSSFKFGLFHDTVRACEVLLADGSVVMASQGGDLFRALPHSYGTLGYILSVTLEVIPVTQLVLVHVKQLPSVEAADRALLRLCQESDGEKPDFCEGIYFGQKHVVTIEARFCPVGGTEESRFPRVHLPDDGTFKQAVLSAVSSSEGRFLLSTYDYFWRWDSDGFWSTENISLFQSILFRRLVGRRFFRTQVLMRLAWQRMYFMQWLSEYLPASFVEPMETVTQDLGVPFGRIAEFTAELEGHGNLPFWMCPMKCTEDETTGEPPFPLYPTPPGSVASGCTYCVDIALFGPISNTREDKYHNNRFIDRLLDKVGGIKTFYSDVLYSREYVRARYNGEFYDQAKSRFDPDGKFPQLYDKVRNKGGEDSL